MEAYSPRPCRGRALVVNPPPLPDFEPATVVAEVAAFAVVAAAAAFVVAADAAVVDAVADSDVAAAAAIVPVVVADSAVAAFSDAVTSLLKTSLETLVAASLVSPLIGEHPVVATFDLLLTT